MRKIGLFLVLLWLTTPFAFANTYSTDLTDLWWNPNESGWGVTATHQREVVFLTFFVYGTDNRPTFYTGQANYSGQAGSGALIYSGPMYQTTGPWLGAGTFNPNAVSVRQVGTVTFSAFIDTATLSYSVDGVTVNKSLTRQTFRSNDVTGNYAGIIRQTSSGCTNSANAGTAEQVVGVTITTTTNSLSMTTNENGRVCNYAGDYVQAGRLGSSIGTYSCPGVSGSFTMLEIDANTSGVTARLSAPNNLCSQVSGRLALVMR